MTSKSEVRTQAKESHVALILHCQQVIGYLFNYNNIAQHLNVFSKESPIYKLYLSMLAHYVTMLNRCLSISSLDLMKVLAIY